MDTAALVDPVTGEQLGGPPPAKAGGNRVRFVNPEFENLPRYVRENAKRGLPLAKHNTYKGKKVVLASTGPSIEDPEVLEQVVDLCRNKGYHLWALKEAMAFFYDEYGIAPLGTNAMDPGGERQVKRTPIIPNTKYYLASSCNPVLYDYLLDHGAEVIIYHSACGASETIFEPGFTFQVGPTAADIVIAMTQTTMQTAAGVNFSPVVGMRYGELEMYQRYYNYADVMQSGFTVTNRAIALLMYLGFEDVILAGCDFGWRNPNRGSHYASFVQVGAVPGAYMSDNGMVDGKPWYTRPDQLASAVDIARQIKDGRIKGLGDTLAVALSKKPKDFLDKVVTVGQGKKE